MQTSISKEICMKSNHKGLDSHSLCETKREKIQLPFFLLNYLSSMSLMLVPFLLLIKFSRYFSVDLLESDLTLSLLSR